MDDDFSFEMSSISQEKTGLPVIIWVQTITTNENGQYNCPKIQFQNTTSTKVDYDNVIPISIDKDPKILMKNPTIKISTEQLELVRQWIIRNYDTLISYWNGEFTTDVLMDKLH